MLASLSHNDPPPTVEERTILDTVWRMVDETEFAVPVDANGPGGPANDSMRLRLLAAAVVRMWAETFRGAHLFEVVKVMGNSLEAFGDLAEKPKEQTPLGRPGHEVSM